MRFDRLTSSEDARFAPAMELYRLSFPAHEQREPASQTQILSHPDYHFTLIEDGGVFAGLLLYWETPAFLYVEHFCIQPDLRGRQCGSRALSLLAEQGKPVILEIDPPADEISRRRKGFYERAGFRENPWPHVHPPYHPGVPGHSLVVLSRPAPLDEAAYQDFAAYLRETVMAGAYPTA